MTPHGSAAGEAQAPTQVPVISHPQQAVDVLLAGGLVGLPTETVYGLAADAKNDTAIARVFASKGRPADHPLIVHIAEHSAIAHWSLDPGATALALAEKLWPGPLTLVVPKAPWVSATITGGQQTVALRVPGLTLTRDVIRPVGAVVAPSANRFGRVSPTTAAHVVSELGQYLTAQDAVLDGGATRIGVESTIVWCARGPVTADSWRVLRPGGISAARIRQVLAAVSDGDNAAAMADGIVDETAQCSVSSSVGTPRVPGALASHYAPQAQVVLSSATTSEVPNQDSSYATPVALLAPADVNTPEGWIRLGAPVDDRAYAQVLYASLRRADELGVGTVVAVPPMSGELQPAIVDRLRRAAN